MKEILSTLYSIRTVVITFSRLSIDILYSTVVSISKGYVFLYLDNRTVVIFFSGLYSIWDIFICVL